MRAFIKLWPGPCGALCSLGSPGLWPEQPEPHEQPRYI